MGAINNRKERSIDLHAVALFGCMSKTYKIRSRSNFNLKQKLPA